MGSVAKAGKGPVVLCLTEKSPLPVSSGSRSRIWHLVSALAWDFDVNLVVVGSVNEAEGLLLASDNSVHAHVIRPVRKSGSITDRARWIVGRGPVRAWVVHDRAIAQEAVRDLIDQTGPDLIWVSGAWAQELLPGTLSVPLILDLQHVERQAIAGLLRSTARRITQPRQFLSLVRLGIDRAARLRNERLLCRRADLVTVCWKSEPTYLQPVLADRVMVLPNGVTPPERVSRAVGSGRLLFVGNLGYAPNADAARWLAEAILPLVRETHPSASVDIIGTTPQSLRSLGELPGVTMHGFVDDLAESYRRAEIVVAPLRAGSGTKIKVLEAFSFGVPVVTTPVGLDGLDAEPEVHAAVGRSASDLSRQITALLDSPKRAQELAQAGLALIARSYTWSSIERAFLERVRPMAELLPRR